MYMYIMYICYVLFQSLAVIFFFYLNYCLHLKTVYGKICLLAGKKKTLQMKYICPT